MTKSSIAVAAVLAAALLVGQGRAAEVAGVNLADKIEVGGKPLVLNGAGLRTRLMLKIYVIGLYLATPMTSADAVIHSTEPRRAHLVMKRSLGATTIWDAFEEGIQLNTSAAELQALAPGLAQIEQLFAAFGDVSEGDVIDIDFTADGATDVSFRGQPRGTIAGTDLQRALLKIWLGAKPVQEDVKRALLKGG